MTESKGKILSKFLSFVIGLIPVVKKTLKFILKFIFNNILLTAILGIIVGAVTLQITSLFHAESYTIYIAGGSQTLPKKNSLIKDETLFGTFKKQWDDLPEDKRKLNGIPIKIENGGYDDGKLNIAKQISASLVSNKKTLIVIGHFLSTTTQAALSNYLNAKPPIPVLLLTETVPSILPPEMLENNEKDKTFPILRLSPTDDSQATTAVEFASSKLENKDKVFWVIEDDSNPVYSNYLATAFINNVNINQPEKGRSVTILRSNLDYPVVPELLNKLNINSVFFIGNTSNALILIRQIKSIFPPSSFPLIILSDTARNNRLAEEGKDDVTNNVYVVAPFDAKFSPTKDRNYYYVKQSICVLKQVIADANDKYDELLKQSEHGLSLYLLVRKLINIQKIEDARLVINSIIQKSFNRNESITFDCDNDPFKFVSKLEVSGGKIGEKIIASPDGEFKESNKAKFHIWKIEKKDGDFQFKEEPFKSSSSES